MTDLHARFKPLLPGLAISAVVAVAAMFLSEHYGAPVMLFALLLGMALNFLSQEEGGQKNRSAAGIEFTAKQVLRLGVALLGLRITAEQVLALGWQPVAMVVLAVALTIVVGIVLARLMGFQMFFGLLTGGAVAICGASAALALSAAMPNHPRKEQATLFTVIGVSTLSTLAMVLYPMVTQWLGMTPVQAGYFIGGTIHDVAQVVATSSTAGSIALATAIVVKLTRVMLLAPLIAGIAVGHDLQADIGLVVGVVGRGVDVAGQHDGAAGIKPGDPYPFQQRVNPFTGLLAQWDNAKFLPRDTTKQSGQQDRPVRPDTLFDAQLREAFHGGTTSIENGLGDCIDCGMCVQVCPTGIDIRDGLQFECIQCAACIDACDSVMDQMGYDRGLVKYTTDNLDRAIWTVGDHFRKMWHLAGSVAECFPCSFCNLLDLRVCPVGEAHAQVAGHRAVLRRQRAERAEDRRDSVRCPGEGQNFHWIPVDPVPGQSFDAPAETGGGGEGKGHCRRQGHLCDL